MKKIVKKIKLYWCGLLTFCIDILFFLKYSNVDRTSNSKEKSLSTLIASYHIIEKGLSMPNRRLGFGKDAMIDLINKCNSFSRKYGDNNKQFRYAIGIIKEYNNLHLQEKYVLDGAIQSAIDEILSKYDFSSASQIEISKEEYFSQSSGTFDLFSSSRHSLRHFDGVVNERDLNLALNLARNAPSACNKQITKVYVVKNKDKARKILELQEGNRGFGHLIHEVIVITTNYSGCTRFSDRFYPYVDAGIYGMNLLYSLHFYRIGAIPLVWLTSRKRDKQLKEIIGAPKNEMPCLIIGIGNAAQRIVCASSPRKELKETVKFS